MGYFSNSVEGDAYQEMWCQRCRHDETQECPVWLAHLLHAYGATGELKSVLDILIPPTDGGAGNGECAMFVPRDDMPA